MLGSTFALPDITAFSGVSEFPDVTSHVVTLQLQNNDAYGSAYGFKGTDYDYKVLIRNTLESPVAGQPRKSRHNAHLDFTKRATVSGGVVTPAIPYSCDVTIRLPETGTVALGQSTAVYLLYALLGSNANKIPKMFNFES
jgi:hypothetical protein